MEKEQKYKIASKQIPSRQAANVGRDRAEKEKSEYARQTDSRVVVI